MGNLLVAMGSRGGASFYHSDVTDVTVSSAGGSGYVAGDGWSVSW